MAVITASFFSAGSKQELSETAAGGLKFTACNQCHSPAHPLVKALGAALGSFGVLTAFLLPKADSPLDAQGRVTAEPPTATAGSHSVTGTGLGSPVPCREQTQSVSLCQEAPRLKHRLRDTVTEARLRECSAQLGSTANPREWQQAVLTPRCPWPFRDPNPICTELCKELVPCWASRSLSGCPELFALRGQGQ